MLEKLKGALGVQPTLQRSAEIVSGLAQRFSDAEKSLSTARQDHRSALLQLEDGSGEAQSVRAAQKVLEAAIATRDAAAIVHSAAAERHEAIAAKAEQESAIAADQKRAKTVRALVASMGERGNAVDRLARELVNEYRALQKTVDELRDTAGPESSSDIWNQTLAPHRLGAVLTAYLGRIGAGFVRAPLDKTPAPAFGPVVELAAVAIQQRAGQGV